MDMFGENYFGRNLGFYFKLTNLILIRNSMLFKHVILFNII